VDAELESAARALDRARARHVMTGQPLLQSLQRAEVLEELMPIHNPAFLKALTPRFPMFWIPKPGDIQQYYGDAVALYFAWMTFMCKWLAFPGLLGLATHAIHQVTGRLCEEPCSPGSSTYRCSHHASSAHACRRSLVQLG
jgi:hypothetical protein